MTIKAYPTNLSDKEWKMIEGFFRKRPHRGGRPFTHSKREIVNAILYVLRSGCAWRLLPNDFPCWSTVYNHFRDWENRGIWTRINAKLVTSWRKVNGKSAKPSAGIIDSQSARTNEKGVLSEDMMEPKKLREEKGISSSTRKGSYCRLKSVLGTLAIKKG